MPVLLMAQGDAAAREQLRQAIEARYGMRPPVIENMRIDFKGRARAKIGPVTTWVPVDVTAQFRLPSAMRWDFTVRPAGVPVRKGVESYDGRTLRRAVGKETPEEIQDEDIISSAQRRLWAIAALLLTPLGDHFVTLTAENGDRFAANNRQVGSEVHLLMHADKTIEQVYVACLNSESGFIQRFKLVPQEGLVAFDELLLPKRVAAFWDDDPWFEVTPVAALANAEIDDSVFTLAQD